VATALRCLQRSATTCFPAAHPANTPLASRVWPTEAPGRSLPAAGGLRRPPRCRDSAVPACSARCNWHARCHCCCLRSPLYSPDTIITIIGTAVYFIDIVINFMVAYVSNGGVMPMAHLWVGLAPAAAGSLAAPRHPARQKRGGSTGRRDRRGGAAAPAPPRGSEDHRVGLCVWRALQHDKEGALVYDHRSIATHYMRLRLWVGGWSKPRCC